MAIKGILGLRTMEYVSKSWYSPSHNDFKWERALAWSECPTCSRDENGHVIIEKQCHCGIHATLWPDEFVDYMHRDTSVGFLVEAIGHIVEPDRAHTWAHEYGFTSSGAQIVGVVNWGKQGAYKTWVTDHLLHTRYSDGKMRMSQISASQYFGVQIFDINTVVTMMEVQWKKYGLQWPQPVAEAWFRTL